MSGGYLNINLFNTHSVKICLSGMLLSLIVACATTGNNGTYGDANENASARAHTDLGAAYLQQAKYEIALNEFGRAVTIDPGFAPAYNGLGLVYSSIGEDAKADENFKKAIQIQPLSSEAQNNYGSFLCARKRYDESIPHFLDAVKNPLYATPNLAYANAGICSVRKGDTKKAEVYLTKALQIDPLTHPAAFQLADIQFNRQDVVGAKATLQNALIAGQSPDVLWLGIKIERILGDKDAQASYALQLRQQYPNSEQTRLLINGK